MYSCGCRSTFTVHISGNLGCHAISPQILNLSMHCIDVVTTYGEFCILWAYSTWNGGITCSLQLAYFKFHAAFFFKFTELFLVYYGSLIANILIQCHEKYFLGSLDTKVDMESSCM